MDPPQKAPEILITLAPRGARCNSFRFPRQFTPQSFARILDYYRSVSATLQNSPWPNHFTELFSSMAQPDASKQCFGPCPPLLRGELPSFAIRIHFSVGPCTTKSSSRLRKRSTNWKFPFCVLIFAARD